MGVFSQGIFDFPDGILLIRTPFSVNDRYPAFPRQRHMGNAFIPHNQITGRARTQVALHRDQNTGQKPFSISPFLPLSTNFHFLSFSITLYLTTTYQGGKSLISI